MEYDNTNRGVLFRNENKKSEKHPDYAGSMDVGGVDHYISAWVKESKQGKKFFSILIKPKNDVAVPAIQKAKQIVEEDFEDDIPF
jgi:uncharacterized protein (DUF736 family)